MMRKRLLTQAAGIARAINQEGREKTFLHPGG